MAYLRDTRRKSIVPRDFSKFLSLVIASRRRCRIRRTLPTIYSCNTQLCRSYKDYTASPYWDHWFCYILANIHHGLLGPKIYQSKQLRPLIKNDNSCSSASFRFSPFLSHRTRRGRICQPPLTPPASPATSARYGDTTASAPSARHRDCQTPHHHRAGCAAGCLLTGSRR